MAWTVGKLAGTMLAAALGVSSSGVCTIAAVGFIVGYMVTYWLLNTLHAYEQKKKVNNYIASQKTYNEDYQSTETLSEKWWN